MKINSGKIWPIVMVGCILAGGFSIVEFGKSFIGSFAAQIDANITGKIHSMSSDSYNPRDVRSGYDVSISTNSKVRAGDVVRFCTTGFAPIYGARNMSLVDGTVVGKLSLDESASISVYPPDENTKQGGSKYCYNMEFNSAAEKYDQISGLSVGISNQASYFAESPSDYKAEFKLEDGSGRTIDRLPVTIKGISPKNLSGVYGITPPCPNNIYKSIRSDFPIISDTIPKGSRIVVSLKNGATFSDINTDQEIVYRRVDNLYAADPINAHNVYMRKDIAEVGARIIGVNDSTLTLETLGDMVGGMEYYSNISGGINGAKVDTEANSISVTSNVRVVSPSGTVMYDRDVTTSARCSAIHGDTNIGPGQGSQLKGSVLAKYVDESGKEIATSKKVLENAAYSTSYSDKEITITGYDFLKLDPSSDPQQGTVGSGTKTIIYVYRQQRGSVVAKYEDEQGNSIAPQKDVQKDAPYGTAYNDSEIQIEGYTFKGLKSGSADKQGTVNDTTQTITYVYAKKRGSVYVRHIDKNTGKDIVPQDTLIDNQPYGTTYDAKPRTFENYKVGRLKSGVTPGDVHLPSLTIVYEYELKQGDVIAKYVDENGNEISPSKTVKEGNYGDVYNDKEIEIKDYDFVGTTSNSAPKSGTLNGGTQTIVYQYRKKRGTIIVRHLDAETGQPVAPQETIKNNVPYGESYTATPKTIANYGAGSPQNFTGTVSGPSLTLDFKYTIKRGGVVAKYIDEDGNEISPDKVIEINQPYGKEYSSKNEVKVPGYKYVGIAPHSDPENGTISKGETFVIYTFEKIPLEQTPQWVKVGETPDPKDHLPEDLRKEFESCEIRYKEDPDTSFVGVRDVVIVVSCEGQDDREIESKVYVTGGEDITVKIGETPDPMTHVPNFEKNFPGCTVRYKEMPDTSRPGTVDAVIIISCDGEEREVEAKVHVGDVPQIPQEINQGDPADPKSHIPDFDKLFPGCTAKYKENIDTNIPGTYDVTIVISCPGKDDLEVQSKLIVRPKIEAPHTGLESVGKNPIPAILTSISVFLSLSMVAIKKKFNA